MTAVFCFLISTAAVSALVFGYKFLLKSVYPLRYEEAVNVASEKHGVEKELIYAIIKCESGFNPSAVSPAGARGLMQITPDTFKWLQSYCGIDDNRSLNDVNVNIDYGVLFISLMRKKYSDDRVVLSAYNAGSGAASRWLKNPDYSADGLTLSQIPYKETRDYVKKVLRAKKIYKNLYFNK